MAHKKGGWYGEPGRHALARKGVRTASKRGIKAFPTAQIEAVRNEADAIMELNLEALKHGMTDWPFVHDVATEIKARAEMIMAQTQDSPSPKANIVWNAANGIYQDADDLQSVLASFGTDKDIAHYSNAMRRKIRTIRQATA